jgi:hypothetical protein
VLRSEFRAGTMQDTVRQNIFSGKDTLKQLQDSTPQQLKQPSESLKFIPGVRKYLSPAQISPDTTTVCIRNPVADVTYYDSTSFVYRLDPAIADKFVFTFSEINRDKYLKNKEVLIKTLKEGDWRPPRPYNADWMILVLLFAAFLFALIRTIPGNFFNSMIRFLTMRGVNENSSRDTGVLFQWQATIFNLASFITISLFGYLLLKHYEVSVEGIGGFVAWLICFGVVTVSITLRHIICIITGNFSNEQETFIEYMTGIYHTYRAGGIIFLLVNLLLLYTTFLPPGVWFSTGIIIAAILYIIRIIRLFLIFMTRHVSILYLILYLCALEILPVVIIVKYVTGLV